MWPLVNVVLHSSGTSDQLGCKINEEILRKTHTLQLTTRTKNSKNNNTKNLRGSTSLSLYP